MKYFAKAKCEIKYAFSYCEAIFHTGRVFHSAAISHADRRISLKKAPTKSMLFSGDPSQIRTADTLIKSQVLCQLS